MLYNYGNYFFHHLAGKKKNKRAICGGFSKLQKKLFLIQISEYNQALEDLCA